MTQRGPSYPPPLLQLYITELRGSHQFAISSAPSPLSGHKNRFKWSLPEGGGLLGDVNEKNKHRTLLHEPVNHHLLDVYSLLKTGGGVGPIE